MTLLVLSGYIFGQEKKKSFTKPRQSNAELLDEARAYQEKDPAYAIKLVEQVLRDFNAKKKKKSRARKKNNTQEADAYTLLGNIYERIAQNDLALQRYQQALSVWQRSKGGSPKNESDLYYRIGRIYLKQKDADNAEKYFKLCLNLTNDKLLKQLCEEWLVDVELLRGNANEGIIQLEQLENNYTLDSLGQSRVNAKRSQVYIQQNDYSNAYKNLENSYNTLPKNQTLKKEDVEDIEKAKEELLNNEKLNAKQKLDVSNNLNFNFDATRNGENQRVEVPSELKIRDNLQIASLLEEKNDLSAAEKFIKISKEVIDEKTDAAAVADVYKKSAEINRKKGALDAALLDLEKYAAAREEAISDLENELKKQIEIVKGQQQIDLIQKDFDIEEKESELLSSQLKTQKIISTFLGIVLLASLVFFYFLNKNVKEKRKANQLLLLKSLRTQMNPHFIFNALNSVNNFIAKNDEKAANKFLSEFSRLMRKVLDYSQRDFISFEEEVELNELYLKLEHFRFRDKFEYRFEKNTDLNAYDLEVPPMLIQPFIENAVWHGLRYKEGKGLLKVTVEELANELLVKIQDDGIGRKKSKALKTANQKKYKSTGLENVSKRVTLINEIYQKNYAIEVTDLNESEDETGTLVRIKIPK
ncbi:MAG: histidine kinase [Bacteroidota bacterium]